MKKKFMVLLFLLVLCSFSSFAFVIGGSNLPLSDYSEFDTYYNPYSMTYEEITDMQNQLTKYLDNCNNDIQRIQESKRAAIEKYNESVRLYNSRM